jgi:hypothetical protein
VSSFTDQLSKWCSTNNLFLNGHMMEEPTLGSQTSALGEAMRCYRYPGSQTPGIDLLNDSVELNTAKQASSVARQKGSLACMSEIYGCTHWYFTFEGHKGCGDWQAALGITTRVHHLAWLSMRGEGKRDYPASINYQSPWCREYKYVEDHFARVNVALTRGKAITRIAVIHPIESYWLAYGPNTQELDWRDRAFAQLTEWLLFGLADFDFVAESLLPEMYGGSEDGKLKVGECEYDAVIMPNMRTVRSTTLAFLAEFLMSGGKVIVPGTKPELIDGQEPSRSGGEPMLENAMVMPWDRDAILMAVDEWRDLDILTIEGARTEKLLYQMRQDGDERFVFICNMDRNAAVQTIVRFNGRWNVELLDTLSGETRQVKSGIEDGWTVFPYRFEGCASALLRLYPIIGEDTVRLTPLLNTESPVLHELELSLDVVEFSEPNVFMLDYARYSIDRSGSWSDLQEILAIDNEIREKLRLPRKGGVWKQPWTVSASERRPKAHVTLEFPFLSDINIDDPLKLAIELPSTWVISINESFTVSSHSSTARRGWWVDEGISTISIPGQVVKQGKNYLRLDIPFGVLTDIERIYLLGDFKVQLLTGGGDFKAKIQGNRSSQSAMPSLSWGDITTQGMPFYVGNIIYKCSLEVGSRSRVTLSVPQFSSPVLKVCDGETGEALGHVAFQPRKLDLGILDAGSHKLNITAFGNRYNAFGHVHLADWFGGCWPDVWRSKSCAMFSCLYYANLTL